MTIALATGGIIAPITYTLNLSANITASLSGDECGSDSAQLILLRENSVTMDFLVVSNGVRLTKMQLEAADDILFMVKQDPLDDNADAIISKSIGDGIIILEDGENDSPNLRVLLSADDTNIESNAYPVGLQVNFSDTDIKEANLLLNGTQCFNEIFISQDVIR